MSLFKTRELWEAQCGLNESFEPFSLCVCGDESSYGQENQIILTGSLDGFLRVYQPEFSTDDHNTDLLLETQLSSPILALHTGRFSNTNGIQIAVLTSSKLIAVKITIPESTEYISQYSLSLLYEHDLPLHPYSLIVGPFGHSNNNDYLCIQSLNGMLSFYEQEQVGITCKLPDLLLPSPLCYVKSTDSFLVCNSSWTLQSFKYQSMANATVESLANAESKLISEWQFTLNEPLIDLQAVKNEQMSFILALGEKNMYCIKDTGIPLWSKKLDYHPMCFALQTSPDNPENLIVLTCTEAGTLLVHKQDTLCWNCKLPSAPIALKTGRFKRTDGFLVALSETGQLHVLYLGTQPVEYGFTVPHRQVNEQECLKEIAALKQQLLMESDNTTTASKSEKAVIELDLNDCLARDYFETENGEVDVLNGTVNIRLPESSSETELHLNFRLSCELITAFPSTVCYQYKEQAEQSVAVQFYIPNKNRKLLIHSCEVEVTAIVSSVAPASRMSLRKVFTLPLQLALRESQPLREALVKVTLASNQPTANLSQLFPDMNPDPSMTNAIALEHLNGSNVTILASRQTNKYRLQSGTLSAMALPLAALVQRLCVQLTDLRLSLDSPLPTQELWSHVEAHYHAHTQWFDSKERVNKTTVQLQMIQRGFHSKVMNTQPAELADGLMLVQIAHDQVMEAINCQERLYQELVMASNSLENGLSCILSLVALTENGRHKHKLKFIQMLREALLPVDNCHEQSWEKVAEVRLNFLMNQWTNQSAKMETNADSKFNDHAEVDLTKLKKRLHQILDIIMSQKQDV